MCKKLREVVGETCWTRDLFNLNYNDMCIGGTHTSIQARRTQPKVVLSYILSLGCGRYTIVNTQHVAQQSRNRTRNLRPTSNHGMTH